ncbi:SRY (sex determining region Y)-box [Teratosphaeria destructans]|uniref:SRY (Sex determining region Y)-box n=1 Tax=Teratosphaeria destructans TaxID=418781 RepID=A0A9W7SRG2_9PEZI|nr:SRY (sex determining region Y)-box [Teratosphaeria destructans]
MSDFDFNAQSTGGFTQEQVSNNYGQYTDDSFSDIDMSSLDASLLDDMPMDQLFDTEALARDQMPISMPMSMPQHVPMPTTTPTMMPQYHPTIGWYYPMMQPMPLVPQFPAQMMGMATPQEGYMPMAALQPMMAPQQVGGFYGYAPQPINPMQQSVAEPKQNANDKPEPAQQTNNTPNNKNKRSLALGTQSLLDDHSEDSSQPPQKRSRPTKQRAPIIIDDEDDDEDTTTPGPRADRRKPGSLYQTCICDIRSKWEKPEKIPRPRNAFIIYRTANSRKIARDLRARGKNGGVLNQKVSQYAGEQWRAEPEEVKERYRGYARQEAEQHRRDYPDYVFRPRRKVGDATAQPGFGGPGCVCGAYEKNLARLEGREVVDEGRRVTRGSVVSLEVQQGEDSLFVPETEAVVWDEGAEIARLRAESAAFAREQQRSFDFADGDVTNSTQLRRSSRTRSGVAYNTTSPLDLSSLDLGIPSPPAPAAAPTPEPSLSSKSRHRPSPIHTPFSTPPAYNTRSRRQSSIDFGGLLESSSFPMEEMEGLLGDEDAEILGERRESTVGRGRRSPRGRSGNSTPRRSARRTG